MRLWASTLALAALVYARDGGLGKRYNHPSITRQWGGWSALGESYASGPGAGDAFDNVGCYRRRAAYPYWLALSSSFIGQHAGGGPEFPLYFGAFEACSGAGTESVLQNQLSSINGSTGVVTLSVGGNDVSYSDVLKACVFYGLRGGHSDCAKPNRKAYFSGIQDTLYATGFHNNYFALIKQIVQQLQWSAEKGTAIYQTGYSQFFDDYTTQCNNIDFNYLILPIYPIIGLDTELRSYINFLLQQLNALEGYWVDQINYQYGSYPTDIMKHVITDGRFTGHRFCRDGVTEPDPQNTDTWFFNLRTYGEKGSANVNTNEGGFVPPDSDMNGTASSYASINPNTCNPNDDSKELASSLECEIAQAIQQGYKIPPPPFPDPVFEAGDGSGGDSTAKIFHPRSIGHAQVAQEVARAVNYVRGSYNYGVDLGLLCVGDSITYGYQSSEGSGYRKFLYNTLSAQNKVYFLGTQTNGQAGSAWQHSEGYSGYTTAKIRQALASSGSLRGLPNIVVLMAGTNDVNSGVTSWDDLQGAAAQLDGLIDDILTAVPTTVLLVAHIPAIGYQNFGPQITNEQKLVIQWNANINQMVNRKRAQNSNHRIFAVHTTPTVYDHAQGDSLHPNDVGYQKLADDFAEGLQQAIGTPNFGALGAYTAGSTSTGPTPPGEYECSSPPNWIPNGQIANGAGFGPNRAPDVICSDGGPQAGGCACTNFASGSSLAVQVPKTGSSCALMSYTLINRVHLADIDGDGRNDYLYVHDDSSVSMYRNGNPLHPGDNKNDYAQVNWIPQGVIATGVGANGAREIQFADLNGDGRADYLRVYVNGSVDAWINAGFKSNNGQGSVGWLPQGQIASGIGMPGSSIMFADLNGDRRAEYLAIGPSGEVTCYLNGGPLIDDGPNAGHRNWIEQDQIAGPFSGARNRTWFADIDGDGRADYLSINRDGSGSVTEWKNLGGPDPKGPNAAKVSWGAPTSLTGGDGSSGANVFLYDLSQDLRAEYLEIGPTDSSITAYYNGCTNGPNN